MLFKWLLDLAFCGASCITEHKLFKEIATRTGLHRLCTSNILSYPSGETGITLENSQKCQLTPELLIVMHYPRKSVKPQFSIKKPDISQLFLLMP